MLGSEAQNENLCSQIHTELSYLYLTRNWLFNQLGQKASILAVGPFLGRDLELQTHRGELTGLGEGGVQRWGLRGPWRTGAKGDGPPGRTKPAALALRVGCSLLKTPVHIQVTSPAGPSGQLSHVLQIMSARKHLSAAVASSPRYSASWGECGLLRL